MTDEEILQDLEGAASEPRVSDEQAEEAALLNESAQATYERASLIPAGRYTVKFDEIVCKKSAVREERDPTTQVITKKGGNLYLKCTLLIIGGEYNGKKLFDNIMLQGGGSERMGMVASCLGFYDRDTKQLTGFPQTPPTAGQIKARLLGQVIGAETIIETGRMYNGKKQDDKTVIAFRGYYPVEEAAGETAPAVPNFA